MKKIAIILSIFISLSTFAHTKNENLVFLLNGNKLKTVSMEEIRKVKPIEVEFYDYNIRQSEYYRGAPFFKILQSTISSAELKKIVEVEVISTNGYKVYYPIENFYKLNAVLTYEALKGPFEHFSKKSKDKVSLAPYFFVWDFKSNDKEDRYKYSSAYQVSIINLNTTAVDFGVRDVKDNEAVNLGFRTYKHYASHVMRSMAGAEIFLTI